MVHPTVRGCSDKAITCYLDNGVRCIISRDEFSDNRNDWENRTNLMGQTIHARILKIDSGNKFLQLSSKRSILTSEPRVEKKDEYFSNELDDIEIKIRENQKKVYFNL